MLKVLLVDDEPFILQGLKLLVDWENEGFRVAGTAANGMEALAFLKKEKVDLVIADIKMVRVAIQNFSKNPVISMVSGIAG